MPKIYTSSYGFFVGSKHGYPEFRNKLRVNRFTRLINPKKNDRILELGSNTGLLLQNLRKYSKNVVGIDINKELIEKLGKGLNIKLMSATDLKFPSNSFDKVCAFEVIEHVPEIKKIFSEAYRVLTIGGRFIISFPFEVIRGQTAILDALAVYKNPFYARKLHVHKLTPNKIKKIIRNLSFRIVESKIMFIPFPSFVVILQKTG